MRPFKVGDRVRLQAGGLAGQVEGIVASLGLLYTTFAQGQDSIMVPNNVVLSAAVVPLREPAAVDLRARLRPDVRPSDVQAMLEDAISTPVRGEPTIALEEIDADEVVVRIQATPLSDADGPRLADEVLAAVGAATDRRTATPTRAATRPPPDAQRLSAWPRRSRRTSSRRRACAGRRRPARARAPRQQRARAQRQRRDVELGAVVLDRLHDGARDVLGRAWCRRTAGACAPESANMPASRMKPGQDDGHADALAAQVLAQREREPAQAELRRRVDRAAGRAGLARRART